MDASLAVLIFMAVALFADIVFCAFKMVTESRRATAQGDFTARVKCDRCGQEYTVTAEEYAKPWAVKETGVTRTKVRGAVFVNKPEYSYYGKRFECPYCKKKHFAQILNREEIFRETSRMAKPVYFRWGIRMFIGGIAVMAVTGIAMKICDWFF